MELFETIKRIAVEAINAEQPCNIVIGTVSGVSPVSVKISPKLTIFESQIVFAKSVIEHTVKMTADEIIDGVTKEVTKDYTVHNGLQIGDEIIIARNQGGQVYYALERIGKKGVHAS